MATATTTTWTMTELLDELGGISPSRVLFRRPVGQATEADVIELAERHKRLCELVDGVLVEKAMGYPESLLAFALGGFLREFVRPRNLGLISGEAGMIRLFPGLIRIPDLAFASWDRFPDRKVPKEPIPSLAPDLVVEVLSLSNTPREMERKLGEYFAAGVRLAWMIDPRTRTVMIHAPGELPVLLDTTDVLDGGDVLPGFRLALADLFSELDLRG